MLSPKPRPPQVQALAEAHTVNVLELPSVEELLSKKFEHFVYEKSYPDELDKPMFVA
jgi:hypothetical protein